MCVINSSKYHIKDGAYFCSAHLAILGFPMGGAYLYMDIFAQFKALWRKQILPSAFVSKKKIGG